MCWKFMLLGFAIFSMFRVVLGGDELGMRLEEIFAFVLLLLIV
jgi:hypothetical protein